MLVNPWEFDPPCSCALVTLMVVGWSVFTLCPLRSQLQHWQTFSGSLMMFSGSLWWIVMIPEFIVGDGHFYQGMGEYVQVLLRWSSHNLSCHRINIFELIVFHVLFLCINKMSVLMSMVHMMNMVIWVIKSEWV